MGSRGVAGPRGLWARSIQGREARGGGGRDSRSRRLCIGTRTKAIENGFVAVELCVEVFVTELPLPTGRRVTKLADGAIAFARGAGFQAVAFDLSTLAADACVWLKSLASVG